MAKRKSKLFIQIPLLLGTAISLFFVPWPIVTAWIAPLPNTVQEQVNLATDYGFDGIVICANRGDNDVAFYTSGYKNSETKTPADPQALFKIASVGKLYNAVAATKLIHNGKLRLNGTLAEYLPELKGRIEYADLITLEMLITHRSGIPNFTDTYMYWAEPKETAEETLALVLDMPANFKPGEKYEYCNTNYLLLDRIISKEIGYSTFQYIQDEILNPLGLEHTYGSVKDVDIDDVMSGYYVGHERDLKTEDIGSMLATAEDLSRFIRALNDGSAFSNNAERELYLSLYNTEHTGLIPGYQTIAKYHPKYDLVVIQFTNTVNFEGYNWNMSEIMYNRVTEILEKEHY